MTKTNQNLKYFEHRIADFSRASYDAMSKPDHPVTMSERVVKEAAKR